jgi:hypothetical protein
MMFEFEAAVVVLAMNPETRSGVSILGVPEGNTFKLPTGLVDPESEESIDAAVRVLWDQAGLDIYADSSYLRLPLREKIDRLTNRTLCAPLLALQKELTPTDGKDAVWVDITDVDFGDHRKIVIEAYHFLRSRCATTNIATMLLPDEFSVQQMRRLCEQLCNDGSTHLITTIHASNFLRKFKAYMLDSMLCYQSGTSSVGRGVPVAMYSSLATQVVELPGKLF